MLTDVRNAWPITFNVAQTQTLKAMRKRIIRTLISVPEQASLQWMGENCGVPDLGKVAGAMSMSVREATELTKKCIIHQGLLDEALSRHTAGLTPSTRWTVVHGASLFAEPEVMNAALAAEPYVNKTTGITIATLTPAFS